MSRWELTGSGWPLLGAISDLIDSCVESMADDAGVSSSSVFVPGSEQNNDEGLAFFHDEADGTLVYEARDRGRVVMHKQTRDPDELVYWVVDDVARSLAKRAATKTKEYNEAADPRRVWFPLWRELVASQDAEWGSRTSREITKILAHSPFQD